MRLVAAIALSLAVALQPLELSAEESRRPRIVDDHISYGDARKSQMAAYSKRHYGRRNWRLRHPHVIVLHFTGGDSYSSAWNTFQANSPNRGELPGVCTHYIVRKGGEIRELVRLRVRCRHAIGLNYTAIGIEMVQPTGKGAHWADRQILERRPQVRAALKLVKWLQGKFSIRISNVIGHSMANNNEYFKTRTV